MQIIKLLTFTLLLSGSTFTVDWSGSSKPNEECCALVKHALFSAYLDFAARHDNNFPRRIGTSSINGDIPEWFTIEESKKCKSYTSESKYEPTEGYMIKITPSRDGKSGCVEARLENKEYDSIMEERDREIELRGLQRWNEVEQTFNFYNID